jgi:hypothetical protein
LATGTGEYEFAGSVLGDAKPTRSIDLWTIASPLRELTSAAPARSGSRLIRQEFFHD